MNNLKNALLSGAVVCSGKLSYKVLNCGSIQCYGRSKKWYTTSYFPNIDVLCDTVIRIGNYNLCYSDLTSKQIKDFINE
jgi:hypothetical protein